MQGGVGIRAIYDDGSPSAFSTVQVFPPGVTQVFAEGMTDRNGRFLFAPDSDGAWRIVVEDGMGHALDATLSVTNGVAGPAAAPPRTDRVSRAIAGVGLILGVCGVWSLWRGRRGRRGP